MLKKYPELLKHRTYQETNPSYKLIEKSVVGPKMKEVKVEIRNEGKKEFYRLMEPGPQSYE